MEQKIAPEFEDDCCVTGPESEMAADVKAMQERLAHLRAFNFGRTVQRLEQSRRNAWSRLCWLLAGLLMGVAGSRVYVDYFQPAITHGLLARASQVVRSVGHSTVRPRL